VVNGMDCAACARKVENAVKQVPGVNHVQVLFATEKLLVSAENDVSKQVEAAVSKAGYTLRSETAPAKKLSLKENLPPYTLIIMMALSWGWSIQPSVRQSGVYRHHAGRAVPDCASGAAPDEKRQLVCHRNADERGGHRRAVYRRDGGSGDGAAAVLNWRTP
jgi:copper chaperone CopZ